MMFEASFLSTLIYLSNAITTPYCPDIAVSYDYIIVGGGSAGAAIAARLAEDNTHQILLLEAGGEPNNQSYVPLTSHEVLGTEMDWNYQPVSQKKVCGIFKDRHCSTNRGKSLGGSSAVNAMIYQRPFKHDLDDWESLGNKGWSYDENFKYLMKLEDYQVPCTSEEEKYHNKGGPMTVTYPRYRSEISHAVMRSAMELGYNITDVNGPNPIGFSYIPTTTRDGARWSTYNGYLKPIEHWNNLKILTKAHVTKVLFESKKATGVNFEWNSAKCTVKAKREIILSAGAFGSPHLLLLSGIGPKEQLAKFNIPLIHDLPGVGENLQDHLLTINPMVKLNQPASLNIGRADTKENRKLWEEHKTGPLTSNWGCEVYSFLPVSYANGTKTTIGEILFGSGPLLRAGLKLYEPYIVPILGRKSIEVFTFVPILLKPKSRGTVTLHSSNPYDQPIIDYNFLSHPDDEDALLQLTKMAYDLTEANEMKKYTDVVNAVWMELPCNNFPKGSDQYIKCVTSWSSNTIYHPAGTCKMGTSNDPMAVVDNKLRVYGVSGLRVADASIMPEIVSGHPNIPCIMIGEKTADLIKEDENYVKEF